MDEVTADLTGPLADRYRIERRLGEGGMATVYLAHDVKHDRKVAVKVLRPELAAVLGADRFLNEVKVTANLQHPHILPLFDSGQADAQLFYVMPYVEGESLRDKLKRDTQLTIDEAVRIAIQVASALDYAHRHGVIHRDVKPENILLHEGQAIVADFGIALAVTSAGGARLTETGLSLGTPQYMSPEQATGERDVDARSDVYSLGCVMYEMLAGEPPHTGPTAQAVLAKVMTEQVRPVSVLRDTVPAHVSSAVQQALAKVPADRPATAARVAELLADPSGPVYARPGRVRRRLVAALIAVTTLLGIGVVTEWLFHPFSQGATAGAPRTVNSVAVLPFINLSGTEDDDYLSDGIAEELIDALTSVSGLRVAPRTSSFALGRGEVDVREIGRRLGVSTVLEGSVRNSPTTLRVTARLSDAVDGFTLWSETFVRQPKDIFAVQEEIAQAIVAALEIELGATATPTLVARAVEDLEAYNLYLRGRYFWNRRTQDGLMTAVQLFEQSVERAPSFAQAYAGLADAYAVNGFYDYLPPGDAFQKARAAAKRALDLDPAMAEPHATLGYIALYFDWNWSDSEREFQRAIALGPEYSVAYQWYANYLTAMGRFDEARVASGRAQQLDPLSLIISAVPGWISYYAGDFQRSVEELQNTLELDPNFALAHLWTGQAYEELGDTERAIRRIRRAVELSQGSDIAIAALAHAYALAGRRDTVTQILSAFERESQTRYVPSFEIAKVYVAMGDHASAFRWLYQAYERRAHSMVFLEVDPQLTALRGVPAFRELLSRVGLDEARSRG